MGGEQRQDATVALGGRRGVGEPDRAQPELGAAVQGRGHRARPGAGSDDEGGGGPAYRRAAPGLVDEAAARARQYGLQADGGEQCAPAHGPGRVGGGRDGGDRAPQDGGPPGQHGQFEECGGGEPRPVEPGLRVQCGEQDGRRVQDGRRRRGQGRRGEYGGQRVGGEQREHAAAAADAPGAYGGAGRVGPGSARGWMAVAERRAAAGCAGAKAPPPVGPVPPCPVCRAGALSIVIG